MKKHIKEFTKLPIVIASTPIGIVMSKTIISRGIFEKSNFMYKSDLPKAFRTFMLIADNGVNILDKRSHCINGTHGNHFSVNNSKTNGFANNVAKNIRGNIIIAVGFYISKMEAGIVFKAGGNKYV